MSSGKPFYVYAHQTKEQAKQGYSASLRDAARTLMVENSVLGGDMKAVNEGTGSAASVPNPEKWLHEAIVDFVKYATVAYAETHALRRIRTRIRGLTSCESVGIIRHWCRNQEVAGEVSAVEYRLRGWGALCLGLSLSITYLKEALRTRIGVKSPEAVFVTACKEGKKPEAAQVKSEITAWR